MTTKTAFPKARFRKQFQNKQFKQKSQMAVKLSKLIVEKITYLENDVIYLNCSKTTEDLENDSKLFPEVGLFVWIFSFRRLRPKQLF